METDESEGYRTMPNGEENALARYIKRLPKKTRKSRAQAKKLQLVLPGQKPVLKRGGLHNIKKVKKEPNILKLTGKFGTEIVKTLPIKE